MKPMKQLGLFLCVGFSVAQLVGCTEQSPSNSKKPADRPAQSRGKEETPERKFKKIDEKERKVVTTSSGLKYEDQEEGLGDVAKKGDAVLVHYTGWLKDGKKFDSSHDRGEPISFRLVEGPGGVIKGWVEGVAGMKVGGKRKLIIPPELAYGAQGHPPAIPRNAELTFEVELLKIK